MKKILLTIVMFLASFCCFAGEVVTLNKSNAAQVVATSKTATPDKDKATAYAWSDKDGLHPIYQGPRGGVYYYKVAKSGKHAGEQTKRYLPKDDAAQVKASLSNGK